VLSAAKTETQLLGHSCYVSTKQILRYETKDVERGKPRNHASHAANWS